MLEVLLRVGQTLGVGPVRTEEDPLYRHVLEERGHGFADRRRHPHVLSKLLDRVASKLAIKPPPFAQAAFLTAG